MVTLRNMPRETVDALYASGLISKDLWWDAVYNRHVPALAEPALWALGTALADGWSEYA